MSKILNTVFGIIGATIVGLIAGEALAFTYVGCDLYLNESNELSDDVALLAKNMANGVRTIIYH